MNKFYFALTTLLLIVSEVFPQPGPATHPMTANGANVLYLYTGIPLKWKNPIEATSNEVYISYDSAKVAQLDTSVKYAQQTPLVDAINYSPDMVISRFFWRVVEKNASGNSAGPVWSFFIKGDAYAYQTNFDDFEFGLSRWSISNNQYTEWTLDNKSNFQLPLYSYNKVLAAKNIQQGFQYMAKATFKIYPPQFYQILLDFSSDLKLNVQESASIEYSTDEGSTWNVSETFYASERNTNKVVQLLVNPSYSIIPSVLIRLKADLGDTSSFWAIDRFAVIVRSGVLSPVDFYITKAQGNQDHTVSLELSMSFVGSPQFSIYRKNGVPSDAGQFYLLKTYPSTAGIINIIDSTTTDSVYTYYVGNSNEATAYLNGITPVELVSFNAVASEDEICFSWRTATETNNRGFYIERSADNKTWTELAFISGAGTTVSANDYRYTYKPGSNKTFYYRLKQQDFDGTVTYSKVEEISLTPSGFYVSQNYPNPFNPQTTMTFNMPVEGIVNISLYNPTGKLVQTIMNEMKQPGRYNITVDGSTLSSGVYFLQVKTLSGIAVKKLILLK